MMMTCWGNINIYTKNSNRNNEMTTHGIQSLSTMVDGQWRDGVRMELL